MRRQHRPQDSDFLDEQEQKDLISNLLSKDKQTAMFYRKIMSYIGFFCGFLKLLCAVMPFNVLPFEHAAHNSLREAGVASFVMAWMEWISSSAYVAGGLAMYPDFVKGFIRKWIMMACIGFSFFISIIVLFLTGSIFVTLWVTGVNCIYLFGCLYVYSLTTSGQNEIINLQKFQYPHKKA